MLIYIIRHGETDANREGLLQGWSDHPLNGDGTSLAVETGEGMRGIHFDEVITSPQLRARQTAELVMKASGNENAPVSFDDRIKELCMGDYEGKRFKGERCEVDPQLVLQFLHNPITAPSFPNGESIAHLMERTQSFLKELGARDDGKTYLVSTHGCALRAMLNFLYEKPESFWHGHVPYNCVVNIVEAKNGELKLIGDDVVYYDKAKCIDRYSS